MYELGIIGTGSMGSALARAARRRLPPEQVVLANRTAAKAEALARELGCAAADNDAVCAQSRFLMLGVKPQMMEELLRSLTPALRARTDAPVLVSMAAGLPIARLQEMAGGLPVIRIMPNTPCAIGRGVILLCRSENVTDADYAALREYLGGAGLLTELPERLIDAGSAISGCGPAFVYTFLEAMADAGVACGLTRADALALSAATIEGAAALAQTGEHPAVLRDRVCSPGGSTIAGVLKLEQGGFRAAVESCVLAACARTKELGG